MIKKNNISIFFLSICFLSSLGCSEKDEGIKIDLTSNTEYKAPTAVGPKTYVGGPTARYSLPIFCNERGEVVSFSALGLDPNPQTYTCQSGEKETVELTLDRPTDTGSTNNLTISSKSISGHLSKTNTTINLPIDTRPPIVVISNNGEIKKGESAYFNIDITDNNLGPINYTVTTDGVESASYNCVQNPCSITTSPTTATGLLSLNISSGAVSDTLGSSNIEVSDDLKVNVLEGTLDISNPLQEITSINAQNYTVSGACNPSFGNVT